MRIASVVVLLSGAAAWSIADGPPPSGHDRPKDDLVWMQPAAIPPAAPRGPVRTQIAGNPHAPAAASGELAGLRAVSLREGSGVIALGGATRPIRPGDAIGSARVKAVGSDRIVLERASPPAGKDPITLVVTFGPDGAARVRTYAPMSAAQAMPPEVH